MRVVASRDQYGAVAALSDTTEDELGQQDRSHGVLTRRWLGNQEWFSEELADPAAYLVAIDNASNIYAGLARIWRNPTGPRFGLGWRQVWK